MIEQALYHYDEKVHESIPMLEGVSSMAETIYSKMTEDQRELRKSDINTMRDERRALKELPDKILRVRAKMLEIKEDLILKNATAKITD